MDPDGELLLREKALPALAPSVEMVRTVPVAAALYPGVASMADARPEARLARSPATVAVTVTAAPPEVRVTVHLSPATTGPRTSKLRDTDTAAAGATPIFVVKFTPAWLMTTRSLPSAIARKPSDAPALIAAARLFAISSMVGSRIPGVVELPSMSMRATT